MDLFFVFFKQSSSMNASKNCQRFMVNLQATTIAFISHERKQVVSQYLYLHFPHNLCRMQVFKNSFW